MPYDIQFVNGIMYKELRNYIEYSDNIADFEHWIKCTHTVETEYVHIKTGTKVIGFANSVAVSKNGKESSVLATAYHVVAPWLNEYGQSLDDDGYVIGQDPANAQSPELKIWKRVMVTAYHQNYRSKPIDVTIIKTNTSDDLACIKISDLCSQSMVAISRKCIDINAINNMVLLGFNFAEMEKDMYDQILTRAQIRDMYGPTGNIAVIGWNKQMLTKICQKSLNLHVKKMTEKCPLLNRFKHYLLTLSGHSGCGISIKPQNETTSKISLCII